MLKKIYINVARNIFVYDYKNCKLEIAFLFFVEYLMSLEISVLLCFKLRSSSSLQCVWRRAKLQNSRTPTCFGHVLALLLCWGREAVIDATYYCQFPILLLSNIRRTWWLARQLVPDNCISHGVAQIFSYVGGLI